MRRREITPIWKDVKRGTASRTSGGNFVMNDGTELVAYYGALVQLQGGYLLNNEDGRRLRRADRN